MLEKIGLPAKPSLRGNNWVIDASHCQGCSSQFSFINRKHHCRRCGGLFCGSCTQQRMYLRGQGEAPVRICEPCKTLEEAARFEMRHGHKNKSKRGASKLTSYNEDDALTKNLDDSRNESVSSNKESVHSHPSIQRATSASSSNIDMEIDIESTTPEELRQRAVEEKKKYKVLKAAGKPDEALRAFKRGKELERQASTLEIELRKNKRKTHSSRTMNENVKQPKEKNDLASELKELGWLDVDLRDADKKPVSMTLEGELSTLLKEVSQKTEKPEKGNFGIDKSEVVAIKKNALALKRDGKLTEAKEELKRAKILEKLLEERELLGDGEDSDDEFTSLIRSMDIDKHDVLAAGNDLNNFDFDRVLGVDDGPDGPDNFEVTNEDMDDPEISSALQSLGWDEDRANDKETVSSEIQSLKREPLNNKRAGPLKSKLVIQRELLALKKKALVLRREGKVDEAEQELSKGKALEEQLEELENGPKVKPEAKKRIDFSGPIDVEDGDVTDTDMNDPSYLSVLQNLGWKDEDDDDNKVVEPPKPKTVLSTKSKPEIQRELLALKRKSLTLRRQGNVDEAEEVLESAKGLETRLAEMDPPKQESENLSLNEKPVVNETGRVGVTELSSVQQRVLAHKRKAVSLKREGRLAEAKEELKQAKLLEKENNTNVDDKNPSLDTEVRTHVTKKEEPEASPPKLSARDRFKLQQESLSHKRQALKLRREGRTEEADAEFELAKNLESQLEALTESVKPAGPDDVGVEDLLDPQLLFALREVGIEGVGARFSPEKADPAKVNKIPTEGQPVVNIVKNDKTELEEEIKAEKVKAVKLKRSGKQAEALEALRQAKLLEKRLNSLA